MNTDWTNERVDQVKDFLRDAPGKPTDRSLGRYRVIREAARGGMAVVYEAVDPDLKRKVALKVLRHPLGTVPAQRFRREATLAAGLSHPGIITVHEVGEADGLLYIAMDFVEGETLHDAMKEMTRESRLDVLEQVADAVGHAHARGITHRDLKPANILLRADGRAVVTDFGLARSQETDERLTRTGAILGTPHYMAPEQVRGLPEQTDARADVWALGVILYEMLAGKRPT